MKRKKSLQSQASQLSDTDVVEVLRMRKQNKGAGKGKSSAVTDNEHIP